jgi:hypothetical protein
MRILTRVANQEPSSVFSLKFFFDPTSHFNADLDPYPQQSDANLPPIMRIHEDLDPQL